MKSEAAQRLEDAIELADIAERMMRHRLLRENRTMTAAELDSQVLAWLHQRPGHVDGDAHGRAIQLSWQ